MKRADGIEIKKTDPMYKIATYIMRERTDSMNTITLDIPLEPIQNYINKKRKEGVSISHMAVILAAYMQTVAEFPMLNRFVVNSKIFSRTELAVGMVVLKGSIFDHGTMSKMYFKPDNTIFEVNDIINKYVSENRTENPDNGTEKIMDALLKVPGVMPIGVAILKWMDKHHLLPKSIVDMSPFHMSLGITNLASIRTGAIHHHCYNFGTTSLFFAMGMPHDVLKKVGDEVTAERCIPLGVVMDERICSGSYFALAFRRLKRFLANPELLEQRPEVKPDPELPQKKKK